MSNEKIDVDINISSDALRSIPQYKAAFDGLRNSIENLNKEILKQNTQSKETVTWGAKVKASVKDLIDTFSTVKEFISKASEAFEGWAGVTAAAFTLITTYGPQVLDFLGNLFQSDKTKQAARDLENYKEIMDTYLINVSSEISMLQMLVTVANNKNLSDQTRLDAIRQLNSLSPEYLRNLTLENIATKEGKVLLDAYTNSLNRKAMEEAIQSKRTDLVKKRLELKDDYEAAKKDKEDYKTGRKKNESQGESVVTPGGGTGSGVYVVTNSRDAAYARFADMAQKDKELTDQINGLDKTLAETLTKFAPKINNNQAHDKAYWETVVADQQAQLDKLDSSAKDFEKRAKPIVERIKNAKQTLSKYSTGDATILKTHITNSKPKITETDKDEEALLESQSRMAMMTLQGYAKEVEQTNQHFKKLEDLHKKNKATVEQLENERLTTLQQIGEKFQREDIEKLNGYEKQLTQISIDNIKDVTERSVAQLKQETEEKVNEMDKQSFSILNNINNLQQQTNILKQQGKTEEAKILETAIAREMQMLEASGKIKEDYITKQNKKEAGIRQGKVDADEKAAEDKLSGSVQSNEENGHMIQALRQQQQLLDLQYATAINAAKKLGEDTSKIDADYANKKAALEEKLTSTKIHAGDKYIDAVLKNSKKDSAIYKAAFMAKKATSIADVIISTKKGIIGSFEGYAHLPFIGQALAIAQAAIIAGQGAASIAEIAKQKPGFASGGRFVSDGRGALLSGYSRTDNTNAYLRSGEAVVVSEAMRNPWARNLVSAINVAHGGRDFSAPNTGRGYAIGGIFTDGGNANRYYNQPVNDIKDMANTLAYQMINNFPPIYVDVKDVNNQQNILAQTVNRVNL